MVTSNLYVWIIEGFLFTRLILSILVILGTFLGKGLMRSTYLLYLVTTVLIWLFIYRIFVTFIFVY